MANLETLDSPKTNGTEIEMNTKKNDDEYPEEALKVFKQLIFLNSISNSQLLTIDLKTSPLFEGFSENKKESKPQQLSHFSLLDNSESNPLYFKEIKNEYKLQELQWRFQHQPLLSLIQQPHIILSSKDWKLASNELGMNFWLKKLQTLKKEGKLTLYQPKPFAPVRKASFQDHLLQELKWMSLDFYEERRWKEEIARKLANEARDLYLKKSLDSQNSTPLDHSSKLFYNYQNLSEQNSKVYKRPYLEISEFIDPLLLFPTGYLPEKISKKFKTDSKESNIYCIPTQEIFEIPASTFSQQNNENKQIPISASNKPPANWTTSEDEILVTAPPLFGKENLKETPNFSLISDWLNSHATSHPYLSSSSVSSRFKSPNEISQRWQTIQKTKAVNGDSIINSSSNVNLKSFGKKEEWKRKVARHVHFMEGVSKLVKKRDHQNLQKKNAQQSSDLKPKLNAHVSHQAIASRAGVEGKKWKTPLEHNERRFKMQKLTDMQPKSSPQRSALRNQPPSMSQIPSHNSPQPAPRIPSHLNPAIRNPTSITAPKLHSNGALPTQNPMAVPGIPSEMSLNQNATPQLQTQIPAALTPQQAQQFIQHQQMMRTLGMNLQNPVNGPMNINYNPHQLTPQMQSLMIARQRQLNILQAQMALNRGRGMGGGMGIPQPEMLQKPPLANPPPANINTKGRSPRKLKEK